MTPERWQRVKAIFNGAVECDPAARGQYLHENCGTDFELQREVESLMAADQEPGPILASPIMATGVIAAAAAVPSRNPDPMIGRTIGNYRITGELARGGMGIVYRARHVTLPREVVVKCIRPLTLSEQARNDLRSRFKREAHIQSQFDHRHIVRVYEFFAEAEEYFLVMEYVPGMNIRSMLEEKGHLPPDDAIRLTLQALDGLAYAHNLRFVDEAGHNGVGIIHRDIKPANLLVDDCGTLKLTDFGIAKLPGEGGLTKTGFSPGTVEYMSPEQIRSLPLDARSDLYSLGVTLYEMLSGRVPFRRTDSDSEYDVLKAHIETDPQPLRSLNPEISSGLETVVAKALKREPAQRWQTAQEFQEALSSLMVTTQKHPAREHTGRKFAGRKPVMAGVAAIVIVTALAAGTLWMRRGGTASPSFTGQPSVAVLPFEDRSPEKNQEYFSDGLAEELLNGLAKTPGLRVAGRTSSFQFRGKAADFSVIGKKLNVGTILEGSVRKQGDRAKIDVRLIKAADGFPLWSETYDRELHDIFAVQEEIARAVTKELKVALLGTNAAVSAKSTNTDAYNLYLQGRYFLGRRSEQNLIQAATYFEQALKLDGEFAPAWIGLGEARTLQAAADYIPREEGFRQAREAIDKALALNSHLAAAHAAIGRIKMYHNLDWVGADASYQMALTLDPGGANAIGVTATLARVLGRLDEAVALSRQSLVIDPLNTGRYLNAGIVFYYAGLYSEAIRTLKKSLELAPERDVVHCTLAQVYLAQSLPKEALAEAEKEPHAEFRLIALALANHALGRNQAAQTELKELIAKYSKQAPYNIAQVYAFRGETDRAFEWLERAYTERDAGITEFKGDPLLKNLERDPRYAPFLVKMRLPL